MANCRKRKNHLPGIYTIRHCPLVNNKNFLSRPASKAESRVFLQYSASMSGIHGAARRYGEKTMTAQECARLIVDAAAARRREVALSTRGRLVPWNKLLAPGVVYKIGGSPPLPALGQTPVRKSDKRRLAFRTEADTEGWRAGLACWKRENACAYRLKDEGKRRPRCERSRSIDWMTATIIDFPIASMTPWNLTSSMAGNLLEAVAVEEMQS
jgi:hypothetical protein